jgi:site-specific recombinase XerD
MRSPLPIFDSLEFIDQCTFDHEDIQKACEFLKSYKGSLGTFNAYRREVERLLHWCMLIAGKTLKDLKRTDIEDFIQFCQKPPKSWIGIHKVSRFIDEDGIRYSNPAWRPFIVTVSKAQHRQGERPNPKAFDLSQSSLKDTFAILGSFYNYLLQEDYVFINPVALIRQKSKFVRKHQGPPKIRRLSDRQWQSLIQTAQEMASINPDYHERTLFILSALYAMYLRISELAGSQRWIPLMNHFYRDSENSWWFTTVGKGNKQRQIAVSDAMLDALKRWRRYLNLSPLPSPADDSALLPKIKGNGPISSTTYIRKLVQTCFDQAIDRLKKEGFDEEAASLIEATVHWLRHTGISDDVKHRPREHVRDDAGHGSGAITDKYIDIHLRERHKSAKDKVIN